MLRSNILSFDNAFIFSKSFSWSHLMSTTNCRAWSKGECAKCTDHHAEARECVCLLTWMLQSTATPVKGSTACTDHSMDGALSIWRNFLVWLYRSGGRLGESLFGVKVRLLFNMLSNIPYGEKKNTFFSKGLELGRNGLFWCWDLFPLLFGITLLGCIHHIIVVFRIFTGVGNYHHSLV